MGLPMNALGASSFFIPSMPYPFAPQGNTFNPTFDGMFSRNTTTSPHLNHLFDITNAYNGQILQESQAGLFGGVPGGFQGTF